MPTSKLNYALQKCVYGLRWRKTYKFKKHELFISIYQLCKSSSSAILNRNAWSSAISTCTARSISYDSI